MSEALTAFKSKLEDDGYNGITGARRAIGKTQGFATGEVEKAQRMANKYFDATPATTTTKKAPKKAAKAVKAAKAKAAKGPGPGRGRKAKAPKKTATAAKAAPAAKAPKAPAPPTAKDVKAVSRTNEVKEKVGVTEKIVDNLKTIHDMGIDVSEPLEMAKECFKRALQEISGVTASVGKSQPKAETKGGNAQPAASPPPVGLPGAAALANPTG